MNISMAIDYLERYKNVKREAEDLEERIGSLRSKYGSAAAIRYSDMPKAHNNSDLSDFVAQLEEFEHKLFVKYEKLLGIEVDTYMTLDKLQDPDERYVLRAYYIDGLQWDQIALKVPCAERTVYGIRLRGLKSLAKILQSDAEK